MQHDSSSIDRDNSEMVRVNLNMGGGELKVGDGAEKLAQADFEYNVPEWKPEVKSTALRRDGPTDDQSGRTGRPHRPHQQNNWSMRLNRDIPMELTVRLGGGDATLNLGVLDLRGVEWRWARGI